MALLVPQNQITVTHAQKCLARIRGVVREIHEYSAKIAEIVSQMA